MDVKFELTLDFKNWLNESDLGEVSGEQFSKLKSKQCFDGRIIINHEDEGIEIVDELESWIFNLCFASIPKVLNGEIHEINYFSLQGKFKMEPEDKSVILSGSKIKTAIFPVKLLLPELFNCGVQFLKWSRDFKKDDESYQANLDWIDNYRAPAFSALKDAGII